MAEWSDLAIEVGALLKGRGQTVAVAESSSGGLISAALLSVPGASAYFKGGGACYTGAAKQILMGVSAEDMAESRASTETHAIVLARSAVSQLEADWGIGETGAAGPTGNQYGDAPGHCCVGVTGQMERVITIDTRSEDRPANMIAFTEAALNLLKDCMLV